MVPPQRPSGASGSRLTSCVGVVLGCGQALPPPTNPGGNNEGLKGLAPFAHWLPRFSLAAIFAYHAWPKLADSGAMAEMMGMPAIVIMVLGLMEVSGAALERYRQKFPAYLDADTFSIKE